MGNSRNSKLSSDFTILFADLKIQILGRHYGQYICLSSVIMSSPYFSMKVLKAFLFQKFTHRTSLVWLLLVR